MNSTKPGSPGIVVRSDLSCTCSVCITDQEGPCFYGKYRHVPESHQVFVHDLSLHVDSSSSSILYQNTLILYQSKILLMIASIAQWLEPRPSNPAVVG